MLLLFCCEELVFLEGVVGVEFDEVGVDDLEMGVEELVGDLLLGVDLWCGVKILCLWVGVFLMCLGCLDCLMCLVCLIGLGWGVGVGLV